MTRRTYRTRPGGRSSGGSRIVMALVMAAVALISYCSSRSYNPVTEETQYVAISPEQEIALGLQSAPQMEAQHGGELPDPQVQAFVDEVCARIIQSSAAQETEWQFECTVLADDQTVNAFALPGGPMYITTALLNRLETEGQLAGVMAHEIGHVVARHSSQRIAKQQLAQGLSGAAVLAAFDPNDPRSANAAQVAALISNVVNMKYGREDELQSDKIGVRFMAEAGYDPRAMMEVMAILAEAGGDQRQPEFMSTHPYPENRIEQIQSHIDELFPNGVPEGLTP